MRRRGRIVILTLSSKEEIFLEVEGIERGGTVGNNTKRGGGSILLSHLFSFSNPNHIRYFS